MPFFSFILHARPALCPNEEGRLVPDLLLFFKKALYEVKASSLQFGFTYFDSPQLDIQQKEIV